MSVTPVCLAIIAACSAAAPLAVAQQSVVIDLTNVRIQHGLAQSRSSAPNTISPAYRYAYEVDGMVRGSGGVLGQMFPSAVPLAQAMETLSPGSSEALSGTAYNCEGTHPVGVSGLEVSGEQSILGINVSFGMNLSTGIDAGDVAFFSLTDVVLSPSFLVGSLLFTSGSVTLTRVEHCPANCDESTVPPVLNVDDFTCFINKFANGHPEANCDCSTTQPVLNVDDFTCFINRFALGCP